MDADTTLGQLKILIDEIIELHSQVTEKWIVYAKNNNIPLFNQKSIRVSDASGDILTAINKYDEFLARCKMLRGFSEKSANGIVVNARVKAQNSVMEKRDDYCIYANHKGKVSINKCFNDLFGIRAIVDCDDLTLDLVKNLCDSYDCLKIENKNFELTESKENYIAIHIYIKGKGKAEVVNRLFRWELQIWTSRQAENNHNQHERHRFKYRRWELNIDENV